MKNILKLSLIVGALFFTINISAKDRVFSISLVDVSSKVLKFEVINAENVSLYFYNDRKDEIYSENLGNRAIVEKTYDLSTLSTGEYFLVAESEFKIEKYRVTIDKDGNEHGKMDDGQAKGITASKAARLIFSGLKHEKKEIWVGGNEMLMLYIRRFVPSLYYYMATRIKPM